MARFRDSRVSGRREAGPAAGRFRWAMRRARAALAFEHVWPRVLPAAIVVALFLIFSWAGLWLVLPAIARLALVTLLAIAFLVSLWPLLGLRLPGRLDARYRVERRSGLAHRPLTALEDRLAVGSRDGEAERLWRAHQARAAAGIGRLSSGMPEPGMARRDPYALRAAVLLLLIVAFLWAGPDWRGRIGAAFAPLQSYEAEIARIDAWVSPPSYTGQPPVLLTGGSQERPAASGAVVVPTGSSLLVRAPRTAPVTVSSAVGDGEPEPVEPANGEASGTAPAEYEIAMDAGQRVSVQVDERPVFEWQFQVVPDTPPSIRLAGTPEVTTSRALRLGYTLEDDYGVVGAEARFEPLDSSLATADPLIPAPDFALTLPQMRARSGSAQTIKELTSHPWAGAEVRVTLAARDDLGQEGRSEPVEIVLPQRFFREPLARALVEQRRKLATDREARDHVAMALHALSQAPEKYFADSGIYLGLRSTYWRLRYARNDDQLRSVVDQLWEIALQVEDGDLSLAAEDLRAAQERLRQALEEGASDAEIEQLMAELRQALNEFMREMARSGMSQEEMAEMPIDPNAQMYTPEDLNRMLDAIEEMARSGARESAQQMLSQLQNLLENLQAGRMMQGQMQAGPMGEMLDELGEMIRRQQELMDETFQADRNQQGGQGEGQPNQLGELGQSQGALREALEALMERLAELGAESGSELGQAGEAMGQAEGALGQGDPGEALGQQGRALESLRRGSQSLAESMMGQGQGYAQGQPGPGRQRTDPFGRPLRNEGPDYGLTVDVPEEFEAQRARQILEELRRRLSEPTRPRLERDYLERLLERF